MDDDRMKIAALKDEIAANAIVLLKLMAELYKANGHDNWGYESPSTREHIRIHYTPF